MSITSHKTDSDISIGNYCVSFIDLLGQQVALKNQGLLPAFKSDKDRKQFNRTLKESIGAILGLQHLAEEMMHGMVNRAPNSTFRTALPDHQKDTWDEMLHTRLTTQRWSDGLVSFVCLGDSDVKCKMNGVYGLFCQAGTLCLLGLAGRHPVRGAIEVAWGAELRPGELYGAAVARAYELESGVAQYPRIVIGPEAVKLLETHSANQEQDPFSKADNALARLCRDMLIQDVDGHWLLHYLGEAFQFAVSQGHHAELYAAARKFVCEQLIEHRANCDTKLALRYSHLLQYFDDHPPTSS